MGEEIKSFLWREEKPNSDQSNIPLLLWRGDENNLATLAWAFGLYDREFRNLQSMHNLKVFVSGEHGDLWETISINLDLPKDEKLARKSHGQAGAGSDFLCTYCDSSRKTVSEPPYSGDKGVNLTSTLLSEASRYCNLNPGKKSQEQVAKHSFGTKDIPITSTEPLLEIPDALHLDINVTTHLITIACRIYHYGGKENAKFQYEKVEAEKRDIEMSDERCFSKLRERITTLPELTQFPGNFAREFCAQENASFVSDPLPDCDEKITWKRLMVLWRCMRSIHKSNKDPSVDDIELFRVFSIEFQEKIYSLRWVPPANQVHRLSHLAFFMQSREVKSIGAFSLEGLEHGNWSTKLFESTRVWKGDSDVGNKQLFRTLRMRGSPSLKRAAKKLESAKRKLDKCSKCGEKGHKKNMRVCTMFAEAQGESDSDDSLAVEEETSDNADEFSDEANTEGQTSGEDTNSSMAEESSTADESEVDPDTEDQELDNVDDDLEVQTIRQRFQYNSALLRESENECSTS